MLLIFPHSSVMLYILDSSLCYTGSFLLMFLLLLLKVVTRSQHTLVLQFSRCGSCCDGKTLGEKRVWQWFLSSVSLPVSTLCCCVFSDLDSPVVPWALDFILICGWLCLVFRFYLLSPRALYFLPHWRFYAGATLVPLVKQLLMYPSPRCLTAGFLPELLCLIHRCGLMRCHKISFPLQSPQWFQLNFVAIVALSLWKIHAPGVALTLGDGEPSARQPFLPFFPHFFNRWISMRCRSQVRVA